MAKRKDCYTDEQKDEVISHVLVQVSTGRFVSRIFAEDEITPSGVKMPHVATFWTWVIDGGQELDDKLVRARERGVEALLDQCGDIADTPMMGEEVTVESGGESGGSVKTKKVDMLGHRRLQIETRIKMAQLLAPRKYGPKVDVTSGGEKLGDPDKIEAARIAATAALEASRKKGRDR